MKSLKKLFKRGLFLIEALEMAERKIRYEKNSIRTEEKKDNLNRYLFRAKSHYEIRIAELEAAKVKIQIWQLELYNRIKSYYKE